LRPGRRLGKGTQDFDGIQVWDAMQHSLRINDFELMHFFCNISDIAIHESYFDLGKTAP
jgi:hypothetical protein